MKTNRSFLSFLTLVISLMSNAQQDGIEIGPKEKHNLIDSITVLLEANYVFPEVADQTGTFLKKKLKNKEYSTISDAKGFAKKLTDDLQEVSRDLHLRVLFDPENIHQIRKAGLSSADSLAMVETNRKNNRKSNYGFREVRVMEGNIGYLNLIGFYRVDKESALIAQAAMNFLSNVDALIIDLRQNGGGSPSMIQLLTSYLYGSEPVHLNDFYSRITDSTSETWTLPSVPGRRRPNVDVYLLTSNYTFSAAEEFSYNLLHLKRATLIGEVTGGGAHPGRTHIATERFTIWIPDGRAINPITTTNWEGVGVQPHIKVPANEALTKAKEEILKKLKSQ